MYRFTLTQLFMAMALVGIFLTLIRSEGCGKHMAYVSCVAFSPDGKQVAAARHDARDSNTAWKLYLENVSRTISVIDASLHSKTVIAQELRRGNQGPAFDLFGHAGNSLVFTDAKTLAIMDFGGGAVRTFDVDNPGLRLLINESEQVSDVCISSDRKTLITGNHQGLSIWNVQNPSRPRRIETDIEPFRNSPLVDASHDASIVASAGFESATVWSVGSGRTKSTALPVAQESRIWGIAVDVTGSQVVVSTSVGLCLYAVDGYEIARNQSIAQADSVRFSPSGEHVAVIVKNEIQIFDTKSLAKVQTLHPPNRATCLCYSPDGRWLVAGTSGGNLCLWDAANGKLHGNATLPGRVRPPWPLSVALLLVWIAGYRWLLNRSIGRDKLHVPA